MVTEIEGVDLKLIHTFHLMILGSKAVEWWGFVIKTKQTPKKQKTRCHMSWGTECNSGVTQQVLPRHAASLLEESSDPTALFFLEKVTTS